LGPFGATAQAPLQSLATQRIIPKLFELAHSAPVEQSMAAAIWPLRFRLDALRPKAPSEPNLAWLFSGHGGALGWVQTVWFAASERTSVGVGDPSDAAMDTSLRSADNLADALSIPFASIDRSVKQILDPSGVFGSVSE
jgi:hypothetical protein